MGKGVLSTEDREKIRTRYPKEGGKQLAIELGKRIGSIHAIARRMGLISENRRWSEKDVEFLKEKYSEIGCIRVAKNLGKTPESVSQKALKLGLVKKTPRWTKKEIKILKEKYVIDGPKKLSLILNKSPTSITSKAKKLGLTKISVSWTKEEESILAEMYPIYGVDETSKKLGRTKHSIFQKASYMQISFNTGVSEIKDKTELIIHDYINGIGPKKMAVKYNTTVSCIYAILYNNHIDPSNYTINRFRKNGSNHSHWKGYQEISQTFFGNLIKSAKDRCIKFDITIEYIWDLFLKQEKKCALSKIDICFSEKAGKYYSKQTASLDRIDSSKGYIDGNVQWVHKTINTMKMSLKQEDFINWCKLVTENSSQWK